MSDLKKRVVSVLLGVVLALTLVACNDDDPPNTTSPDGTGTTEPVGS